MKYTIHSSQSRGKADHNWLKTNYSFSFADYYNPERMGFGALRVLNDDSIAGGMGFDAHPHQNMEIITIPLSGGLEHKDNLGNTAVSKPGDIQVMSAGSGVFHSEYNAHRDQEVSLLQIWVIPNVMGVTPRYEQRSFDVFSQKNMFHQIVSPMNSGEEGIGIYQDARFQRCMLEEGYSLTYTLKQEGNGVYIFVISGELYMGDNTLYTRDAIAIEDIQEGIICLAQKETEFIIFEVPV